MNRRQVLKGLFAASAAASVFRPHDMFAQEAAPKGAVVEGGMLYLHPAKGDDGNAGTKERPLKTLAAAAKRANESTGTDALTIVLAEGVYAVGETAVFKPTQRTFTKQQRLTIRAEFLPDDAEWHAGRMPTLIHTMPLSPNWNGRPDQFGGVAYGMQTETSHVTIQGLKILGMPVVEHPKSGAIHRVYPIGRNGRNLDDLEIKQCLFAGEEVSNPHHLSILANGSGIVVDHCIFHNVKQPVVYWTGGSKGHAMRYCLVYSCYGCGLWTSGIANDFEFRNNVIANGNYIWISQSARSASREAGQAAGGENATARQPLRYKVIDSLFTGNKKFTGSGGGPALNFKDIDPGFLELVNTKRSDEPLELELDQTKRNYLHAKEGSEAARIGAGLLTTKA